MILTLLVLVVFGPHKASSLARDVGRFVNEARRAVEELKTNWPPVKTAMNPLATYPRAMVRT
jgi:Sec-independent protein translocase protein TatA